MPFLIGAIFGFNLLKTSAIINFDGGDGTPNSPYQISSCIELQNITEMNASYELTSNIDCTDTINWNNGNGFTPIGTGYTFNGTFNGNNHTISGLYIHNANADNTNTGLFYSLNGAKIYNINFDQANISSEPSPSSGYGDFSQNLGIVAGWATNNANIFSITVTDSSASLGYNLGGIVGRSDGANITNISMNASLLTDFNGQTLGGIVGLIYYDTTIQDVTSNVVINSYNNNIGGIVGEDDRGAVIQRVLVQGSISTSDTNALGGIVGANNAVNPTNIYSVISLLNISSDNNISTSYSGSIVGHSETGTNNFNIQDAYYDSTLTYLNNCSGDGLSESGCTLASESDFYGSAAINSLPESQWDFSTTWAINDGALPSILQNFDDSLVGNYKLDEGSGNTAADSSGLGYDGTLNYSPTWVSGYKNNGLNFSGHSSSSTVSTTLPWPETSGSMSEWVYPMQATGQFDGPSGWKQAYTGNNDGYVLIDQGGSDNTWRAVFNPSADLQSETSIIDNTPINYNHWQNLIMTWNEVLGVYNVNFYVNGLLIGTTTYNAQNIQDAFGNFNIGNTGTYPDNWFTGNVDEVKVYNRSLGTYDISQIANQSYSPSNTLPLDAVPGSPVNLSVVQNNTTGTTFNATISWNAPSNAGQLLNPINRYTIKYRIGDSGDWSTLTSVDSSSFSFDTSLLLPSSNYELQIIAHNSVGDSDPSQISYTTPDPSVYMIHNCNELQAMDTGDTYGHYILANDIDCSDTQNWNDGSGFTPIGSDLPRGYFEGVLDGASHTITNLTINTPSANECSYASMFTVLEDAEIKNLKFVNPKINSPCNNSAVIASVSYGSNINHVQVINGSVDVNNISVSAQLGGLTAYGSVDSSGNHTSMSESSYSGTIGSSNKNTYAAGGLFAVATIADITNSYSNSIVNGYDYTGGLVGYATFTGINNSYSAGSVIGCNGDTGGLMGASDTVSISNDFVASSISNEDRCPGNSTTGSISGEILDNGSNTYNNNYIDTAETTYLCTSTVLISGLPDCSSQNTHFVNAANNPNNLYFINNSSNPPLDSWNFSNIWYKKNSSYPLLYIDASHSTLPAIHLNGDSNMQIVKGSSFTDPGAYVTDSDNSVLMHQIVASGAVDPNTVGEYSINYDVSDNYGNEAQTVTRIIEVVNPSDNNNSNSEDNSNNSNNNSNIEDNSNNSNNNSNIDSSTAISADNNNESASSNQSNTTTTVSGTSSTAIISNTKVNNTAIRKNTNYHIIYIIIFTLLFIFMIIFLLIKRRKKKDENDYQQ